MSINLNANKLMADAKFYESYSRKIEGDLSITIIYMKTTQ